MLWVFFFFWVRIRIMNAVLHSGDPVVAALLLLWFCCSDTGTNGDAAKGTISFLFFFFFYHQRSVFVRLCTRARLCAERAPADIFSEVEGFSPRWLIICSASFKDRHSSPIFLWWAFGGRRWRLSVITTTVLGPADKTLTSDCRCEIQISALRAARRRARRTGVLALTSTGPLMPELPLTHWLLSFIWKASSFPHCPPASWGVN